MPMMGESSVTPHAWCENIVIDCACRHVKRYAGPYGDRVNAHCLYRFDDPVSPHLAVHMAAKGRSAGVRTHACLLSFECRADSPVVRMSLYPQTMHSRHL